MSDRIFQFKQFSISDKQSAMKIGTDGVLLGAWANVENATSILDIGSGCGLISLMTAQRSNAQITGIEIDVNAVAESRQNIAQSKWSERVSIISGDFNILTKENMLPIVDHIISNPPFFETGPQAPSSNRAMARHGSTLTYNDIISAAPQLLTPDGKLSIISPVDREGDIVFIAEIKKLHLSRLTKVSAKKGARPVRLLWEFSMTDREFVGDELFIKDINNEYSEKYKELTNDFYLNI